MKPPSVVQRSEELRRAVADDRLRLDAAVAALGRVSKERLTLGGHMSRAPWPWLLGAGACGLLIGLLHHRTD